MVLIACCLKRSFYCLESALVCLCLKCAIEIKLLCLEVPATLSS